VPTRAQLPGPANGVAKMPTSVLTTSLPRQMTELLAGASGRLPLTLVHVLPPFRVTNTWPTPAFGIQCREKPPKVTTACAAFAGSMVNEVGTRFGSTLDVTACQVPPKLVARPEVNGAAPPGLQPFPHQPA